MEANLEGDHTKFQRQWIKQSAQSTVGPVFPPPTSKLFQTMSQNSPLLLVVPQLAIHGNLGFVGTVSVATPVPMPVCSLSDEHYT